MVGRALAADADVLAGLAAGLDGTGQQRLDGRVALVEAFGHQTRVTVQTQGELGHVIGADGEAVEVLQELVGQDGVGGQFAHHDDTQRAGAIRCTALAPLQAMAGQQLDDARAFLDGAHEGDHQLDVGQAHVLAHALHGLAFHLEAVGEGVRHVARCAPEAQHGVLFLGLIARAADELAVFVALEVGQAHDDRLGPEGSGDGGHTLGQLLDVEGTRAGVAPGHALDGLLEVGVDGRIVENGTRVDADVVVDDELQPGQAHAVARQRRKLEGELRVADVHHDLGVDLRHGAGLDVGDFGLELAVVDVAGVALGARDGDEPAVSQHVGGVAAADDGGNAQLTRDDGSVAGAPAPVGDDGRGTLHDRFPVGVGHVGDENIAGLHAAHLGRIAHQAHAAGADLLADGTAGGQHVGAALEDEALLLAVLALRLDRLGTGLEDEELAIDAVLAPLDVHGTAIVLLDDGGVAGQLGDLLVGEGKARTLLGRRVDGAHGAALGGGILELHLDELGAQVTADDGVLASGQHGLVDVELVGVDGPLHDGLAQAPAAGDEHHVLETGFGVDGEHHARGAQVAAAHALDAGRQGHALMGKALVDAVGDGAVVVERGKDLADAVQDGVDADDIEDGLLLAGEGGVGQVLGGGAGAHGERDAGRGILREAGEVLADGLFQVRREGSLAHPAADLGTGLGQGLHVVGVEGGQTGVDALGEPVVVEEVPEGVCGGGKAARHLDARCRELADQLAQRGILAAHDLDIGHAQLFERDDEPSCVRIAHG